MVSSAVTDDLRAFNYPFGQPGQRK